MTEKKKVKKAGKKKVEPKKMMEKTEETAKKEEKEKQNKLLRNILIFIGVLLIILIVVFIIKYSSSKIEYKGVKFNVVKEGDLIFYQTSFQVIYNKELATYNIYLRNNPKDLEKEVPFDGTLNLRNILVLNTTTENLFCGGDWNLAIGNMKNLGIFNIDIMKDENANCSQGGEYMFVQIEEGEESRIEQYGPSCYKLIVNNCEILPVTERFMIEAFSEVMVELNK